MQMMRETLRFISAHTTIHWILCSFACYYCSLLLQKFCMPRCSCNFACVFIRKRIPQIALARKKRINYLKLFRTIAEGVSEVSRMRFDEKALRAASTGRLLEKGTRIQFSHHCAAIGDDRSIKCVADAYRMRLVEKRHATLRTVASRFAGFD